VPDELYVAADAASALSYHVQVAGWSDPAIPGLVTVLVATANPDGGYGLARPWDAYQDGTVNPATTSYTATTAGHVGPVLLAGYLAGAVSRSAVEHALDWLLDLPRAPGDVCIPYSSAPEDLGRPCVWNVHFGAAAWVKQASAATSYRRADAAALAVRATSVLQTVHVDPSTGYLPYSSSQTRPQDIGHQLWTSLSIDALTGGSDAMTAMVNGPLWRDQARRFRDYNVASAMGGIALADCRFATDRTVLTYADSTARGTPYVFRALAAQARQVAAVCFATSSRAPSRVPAPVTASEATGAAVLPTMNLG
jgi:hypothetical protein